MSKAILFIDHATALGGAEHSLLLILQHLNREQWSPHVVCCPGALAQKTADLHIPHHTFDLPRLRRSPRLLTDGVGQVRQLAKLARQLEATALYANTVRAALYAAPAARLAKRPFIWHMRDFWLSENKPANPQIDTTLKKLLCRTASRVITNSQAVADHMPCPGKTSVVLNGIDVSRYDPTRRGITFKKRYEIPDDVPIIGMVGRLRPWKGQVRFLEMAAEISQQHPAATFIIVGGSPFGVEDDYPQQLQQLTADLNLSERVLFTGHLDDVRPALAAMTIFVHPGEPEPFGLVNVEAMAMGKPVVALGHGALPEIVLPGETGLLVLPGDQHGLAQAVMSLLKNPAQCARMGQAGRERVVHHFTIQRTTTAIEAILRQVTA
ncbi:MAG: glycosyltransferase family 4 protein [Ardenticatenaceae bacterium]|nr:glycosyltransferase family 4 protein [Ardenticatenaceae bacterium]